MNFVNAYHSDDQRSSLADARTEARFAPVFEVLSLVRRRARLIAATTATVLCVAIAYLVFSTPIYRATIELYIDPQALQVVGRGLTRSDTAASIEFAGIDSQALILTSTSLLENVISELNLQQDPYLAKGTSDGPGQRVAVLDALRQRIVVRRVDASLVFQITVAHPVAEQAARIANAIGAAYFRLSSKERGRSVSQASATLVQQSTQLRNDLAKADEAVESFKVKTGLISTGEAGLLVSQQLKDLYTQISLSEANLPRLAARRNELRKVKVADIAAETSDTPEAMMSPVIGALRAQYAGVVQSEARTAGTFGERHPELANLREQKRAVLEQIQNELGRIARSSDEEYRRAQESLAGLKKQATLLVNSQIASDEAKIKLRQLESEARAIRGIYDESATRVKELQQQQQIETNNSRIISEAVVPLRPSGAPKALVLISATLFGLVLGCALGYLLDLFGGRAAPVSPVAPADGPTLRVAADLSMMGANGIRAFQDSRALIDIAKTFRKEFGTSDQAILIVTGYSAAENARIADDISDVLIWSGETVYRSRGGFGKQAASSAILTPPTTRGDPAAQSSNIRYTVIDLVANALLADPLLGAVASKVFLVAHAEETETSGFRTTIERLDPDYSWRQAGHLSLIRLQPDNGLVVVNKPVAQLTAPGAQQAA